MNDLPMRLPEEASSKAVDFLTRLMGPVAELADWGGDKVRFWRFQAALKTVERATELAEKHGIEASKVPMKYLVPFLDKASLEEDDELTDAWSSLLASASREFSREDYAFAEVLARITRDEAVVLDFLAEKCDGEYDVLIEHAATAPVRNSIAHYLKEHACEAKDGEEMVSTIESTLSEYPIAVTYLGDLDDPDGTLFVGDAFDAVSDDTAVESIVGLLKHLGLVTEGYLYLYPEEEPERSAPRYVTGWIMLTAFGWRFVERCSLGKTRGDVSKA